MSVQTILQYNGVRIQNCQTVSFVEVPVHDESGGDYMYTKTTLKVVGYVTTDVHRTIGVYPVLSDTPATASVPSRGASQHMAILRQYLEEPRKRLVYSTVNTASVQDTHVQGPTDPNGLPIFEILPAPNSNAFDFQDTTKSTDITTQNDVHGGPYPREVNVSHIANNNVWKVEFTVEFATFFICHTNSLPAGSGNSQVDPGDSLAPDAFINEQLSLPLETKHTAVQRRMGILSNRWSCHDAIDENGFTVRTYTGIVRLANPNWNPNDFRAITIPPIQAGMMRSVVDYTASEDNLTLRWQVVDKEVGVTAPQPARTMRIVHNESLTKQGFYGEFNIRVHLMGTRTTRLADLLVVANAIVEQRLFFGNPIDPNSKARIMIDRKDVTSEQGTDANYSITLVVAGRRFVEQNAKNDNGQNPKADVGIARNLVKSVTWRLVKSTQGALANYNNQLSFGNRAGEQPKTEGEIRAITALHARLSSTCITNLAVAASVTDSAFYSDRADAESRVKATVTPWGDNITVQIDDNIQDFNSDLKYSTDHQTNLYTHYNITSEYGRNALNVALPVANTTGSSLANVPVTIGPPQPTRKIRIQAERVGAPPKLPEPVARFEEPSTTGETNTPTVNTLNSATVQHLEPRPMADGVSLLYTSYMDLVYFQIRFTAMNRT